MVIAAVYKGLGSKRCSGIVTNLGSWSVPAGMADEVESFEVVPTPPNSRVKVTCAMVSYKDKFRIIFCNISHSNELERRILKHLTGEGVHVRLLSNF
jgi:NRPS condensation-like uncharacterized protein